ncbi:hypothetical protein BH11PSE9_BH11PSE9_21090 [soil metagenome]
MDIPFSILKSAGGNKGAALLALLAGLYIVNVMRTQQQNAAPKPRP